MPPHMVSSQRESNGFQGEGLPILLLLIGRGSDARARHML
jgi:hypothetical protein